MDNIKELGKRRGLFENEIELNDTYATIIRFLRDEVKIFNWYPDIPTGLKTLKVLFAYSLIKYNSVLLNTIWARRNGKM